MDINALLSPSDSPVGDASSSEAGSPRKGARQPAAAGAGGKRPASLLDQGSRHHSSDRFASTPPSQYTSTHTSPTRAQFPFPSHASAAAAVPNFRPLHQAPTSNPSIILSPTRHGDGRNYQSYQQRPIVAHRPSSTPHMETLAGA
jgi:hypothetical protein